MCFSKEYQVKFSSPSQTWMYLYLRAPPFLDHQCFFFLYSFCIRRYRARQKHFSAFSQVRLAHGQWFACRVTLSFLISLPPERYVRFTNSSDYTFFCLGGCHCNKWSQLNDRTALSVRETGFFWQTKLGQFFLELNRREIEQITGAGLWRENRLLNLSTFNLAW